MFNQSFRTNLMQTLHTAIAQHVTLDKAYEHIETLVLGAFNAERMSIFQRRSHHRDLVSRYKTGSETRELKVSINPQSIAGYVAMAQQAVTVNNPYDEESLRSIHYKLRFDQKHDRTSHFRTHNILSVPIKHKGVLLGVMEVLNKESSGFDDSDLALAVEVGDLLGKAFKHELGGTTRPFDYLIHNGSVAASVLSNFSSHSSVKHVTHLLHSEYDISHGQICEALSVYYQVPFIDYLPNDYHLSQSSVKQNVSYYKRNHVAVVKDEHQRLIVLMFEPNNTALLMEIESALGTDNYQLAFSLPNHILHYLGETSARSNLTKFDEIIGEIDTPLTEEEGQGERLLEDEPAIVRLVSNILFEAKRINASDIHIDPEFQSPTLVRMRVDGVVRDINQVPESHHKSVVARIKIMSGLNIAEKRIPQDGKLMFTMSGQNVEVRVATIPTVVGEGVVMRILAGGDAMPIDKINLSERNLNRLKPMVTMPHGILLVVGPTGSGKTTTLHAILGFLNTPDRKIWTAEDPVEITQYRLQQVQVNPKVGFTYANALRAFLRADPDVILIGEMRDKETAHAGIEASLTGHLVLSTLHTNSAPETITRLLDLGMDPVNFSDACVGILAQRLIRTLCKKCKVKYVPTDTEVAFLKRQYGQQYFDELNLPSNFELHKAKGCQDCDDTGYKGRTGVHELLSMTPNLRSMIYKGASIPEMKTQAMLDGMRTLTQDAVLKVLKGDTDIPQAQILSGSGMWQHD